MKLPAASAGSNDNPIVLLSSESEGLPSVRVGVKGEKGCRAASRRTQTFCPMTQDEDEEGAWTRKADREDSKRLRQAVQKASMGRKLKAVETTPTAPRTRIVVTDEEVTEQKIRRLGKRAASAAAADEQMCAKIESHRDDLDDDIDIYFEDAETHDARNAAAAATDRAASSSALQKRSSIEVWEWKKGR